MRALLPTLLSKFSATGFLALALAITAVVGAGCHKHDPSIVYGSKKGGHAEDSGHPEDKGADAAKSPHAADEPKVETPKFFN